MLDLKSVSKPVSALESMESMPMASERLGGAAGSGSREVSRALEHLVVKGKGRLGRDGAALETVIGEDERVRIIETDLLPWRMICALRMRGQSGAGAIGTGWFIGPQTLLTAGHCVHSADFFGGWVSTIEVIPGLRGAGDNQAARPFGSVVSSRVSSVDRWVEHADPDFDVGCIHLDEPKGEEVGWFGLAALTPDELVGYLVNISGYPGDRGAGNEQYHAANRVMRVTDRRLFYEVDTFGGQSGAPVWVHEEAGAPPLGVGIHAYGIGGTPSSFGITANSAPRLIPEVLDKVKEWLAKDGA